jgi:hypothetical protein
MLNLITLDKEVVVNGTTFKSAQEALEAFRGHSGKLEIYYNIKQSIQQAPVAPKTDAEYLNIYRVEVRQYMTQKGSPDFDFMIKYNDNKPMPLRRMYGEILEETKGMYRMKLHGRAERNSSHCSHCMRELTHPISVIYGIGPVCGEHGYFASDYTKSKIKDMNELFSLADRDLRKTEWTGWIIKKAIQSWSIAEQIEIKEENK